MDNNFPLIKIVEGNAFSLILPLKKRTYQSCRPIDEDIDATQLTNLVVKFGGVEYEVSVDEQGVRIDLPATLALGMYSIVLTATYQGSEIRAAYESAVQIVTWNEMSNAQQYIQGSPIVMESAYVIGGTLTDAELEALKEEYREKNAQLAQAIADAEAAKAEWEQKAAELDGVAKQSTLTQGVADIRDDISHIDIDTSDLAKQGTNPNATLSEVQAEIDAISPDVILGKQQLAAAITEQGVPTLPSVSLLQMAENVGAIVTEHISTEGTEWAGDAPLSLTEALFRTARDLEEIVDDRENPVLLDYQAFCSLKRIHFTRATDLYNVPFYNLSSMSYGTNATHTVSNMLEEIYAPKAERIASRFMYSSTSLRVLYLPHANVAAYGQFAIWEGISICASLIDLTTGEYFTGSTPTLRFWNPTNALLPNSQTLLTPEDIAAGFTSNLEKLLYNIREHIAANLPDMTGQSAPTLTMSAAIKAAIKEDTEN